jgi:hypothetical protein
MQQVLRVAAAKQKSTDNRRTYHDFAAYLGKIAGRHLAGL